MKWYDASDFWPGRDSRNIIIKGSAGILLKDKYELTKDHGPIRVSVKYMKIIENSETWDCKEKIDLTHAHLYDFDGYCCNACEVQQEHHDYLRKIGCNYLNIRKFCDASELYANWEFIDTWAPLEQKDKND